MGVKHLMSFLRDCDDASQFVKKRSIEKLANEHRQSVDRIPALAVDGSNFVHWLYNTREDSNEFIYGGQWIQIKKILNDFVSKFKDKDIQLVFIFDGPIHDEKKKELMKRRMDSYKNIDDIFANISENPEKNAGGHGISPALKLFARIALKELGVKVCQTDKKVDADNCIADYAKKNEEVFAIMSDDSDLIIFDTKPVLSTSEMNLVYFTTVMYDRKVIAENYLKISLTQLPLFACLMGNDYVQYDELNQFHLKIAGYKRSYENNKLFIEAKVKNLCKMIKKKKWSGDYINKKELNEISKQVFEDGNKYNILERGLKSYVVSGNAEPFKLLGSWSTNFEKTVRERHNDCSNTYIFNLLCTKEYGSYEVLEDGSTRASALIYREIRQRCYGLLFDCFLELGNPKPIVIEERCWYKKNPVEKNDFNIPEEISPLPLLDPKDVMKIEDLWLNCEDGRRYEFFRRILQIPMELDLLMQLAKYQKDQLALSCILNYLISRSEPDPFLEPLEVAVFVAQAVWKPSLDDIKELENPQVRVRAVNLSTLFVIGIKAVLMALEICGFKSPYIYAMPWEFFDGKLFHFLYNEAEKEESKNKMVQVLCNNKREITENFYRLLPVVTNNTKYHPNKFEWSNILKDFKWEQEKSQ